MQISQKKECKRTQHSFYKFKKECSVLFSIYIYIYISLYIYVYLYISIYILKKNGTFSHSFAKERNVLLGLISRQNLKKRTEKNGTFFFKNGKERNVPNGKERSAQPWKKFRMILVSFFCLLWFFFVDTVVKIWQKGIHYSWHRGLKKGIKIATKLNPYLKLFFTNTTVQRPNLSGWGKLYKFLCATCLLRQTKM